MSAEESGATGIRRFEEIVAWQKARELAKDIYTVTGTGRFAQDWGLRDQIRRATVSILSNVAEGYERGSRAEFHQFLVIAKGSCAEARAQLYVAFDAGYLTQGEFADLLARYEECARIIGGLRASVAKQRANSR
jgi:four helix bundle protein